MDIAALLAPGSATPSVAVPTVPAIEMALPGEAFSDLLVAAMAPSVETPTIDVVQGTPVPAVAPVAVAAVDLPVSEVPASAAVEAVTEKATEIPSQKEIEVEGPRPLKAKRPDEPAAPSIESGVPLEDPPEPPLKKETSRKDANAEAPIAPATVQDRPEEKTSEPVEAPMVFVSEAPAALASASVPPVVAPKPEATSQAVAPSSAPNVTLPTPKQTVSRMDETQLQAADLPEQAVPDTTILEAPVAAGKAPDQSREPVAVPVGTPREGKTNVARDSKMPQSPELESAPDLGVVPKVTTFSTTPLPTTEPLPTAQESVLKMPKADVGAAPMAIVEAPMTVEVPEAEVVETVEASVPAEATVEQAPTSGGDAAPNDERPTPENTVLTTAPTVRTSATERPEAGAQRPEIDRHLVVRQVADRVENLVAARPREGVTIHLEPQDLGSVTLVVKGLASALDVQMTASDERVRESLDASRPELAQALAPRGIELRELRVATTVSNGTSMAGRDAGTNPDGRPRQHTPSSPQPAFVNASGHTAKAPSATRASRTGRGVDLLV